MGLLSRKPAISMDEFCKQYYDSEIFERHTVDDDVASILWHIAFNSAIEGHRQGAEIDLDAFQREIAALHLELFGLAWVHRLKVEEYIPIEIISTEHYLEHRGRLEIWKTMAHYNQAIGYALQLRPKRTARPSRLYFAPLISQETLHEAWRKSDFYERIRAEIAGKYTKAGVDPECATRLANRMSTDAMCYDYPVFEMLTATMKRRLGYRPNDVGRRMIQLSISALYARSRTYMRLRADKLKLQFSR